MEKNGNKPVPQPVNDKIRKENPAIKLYSCRLKKKNMTQFSQNVIVKQTSLRKQPSFIVPGARFSKLPEITGPVKQFCFPFQMGVSKV